MEKYRNYAMEDFLREQRFQAWVISGNSVENAFWEEFLIRFPAQENTLRTARAMFRALHELQDIGTNEQGDKIWESINEEISAESDEKPIRQLIRRVILNWLSASVAAIAVVYFGWYMIHPSFKGGVSEYHQQVRKHGYELAENINTSKQTQKILLSDGSYVLLKPNARISFQSQFTGKKREVYLAGTAYFNVFKNNKKPFIVYANQLVVQVVGTSFTVNSSDSYVNSSVSVESGKVKVFDIEKYNHTDDPEAVILLSPNQQVSFNSGNKQFSKSLVSTPAIISKPDSYPDFNFRSASVNDVFKTLESAYGVKITCDQETIARCHLTAQLGNETLFRKLDIICQTIGANYEVWGTEIIVSGGGCNH